MSGEYGFVDKNGNWWIPTGKNDTTHSGEHWDVIDRYGNPIKNVYSDGYVRYHNKCESLPSESFRAKAGDALGSAVATVITQNIFNGSSNDSIIESSSSTNREYIDLKKIEYSKRQEHFQRIVDTSASLEEIDKAKKNLEKLEILKKTNELSEKIIEQGELYKELLDTFKKRDQEEPPSFIQQTLLTSFTDVLIKKPIRRYFGGRNEE